MGAARLACLIRIELILLVRVIACAGKRLVLANIKFTAGWFLNEAVEEPLDRFVGGGRCPTCQLGVLYAQVVTQRGNVVRFSAPLPRK